MSNLHDLLKEPQRPNFFVAGVPKCGTSFFHTYLRQHPEIFVPEHREAHYFASDLGLKGRVDVPERYAALYKDVRGEKAIGDFSNFNLYSEIAPQAIKTFAPTAKIIILLRDPVSMMNSLHLQYLSTYDENVVQFSEAVGADEARRRDHLIPANSKFGRCMAYLMMATYSDPIARYFEMFGRE